MSGTTIKFFHSLNKKPLTFGVNKELYGLIVAFTIAIIISGQLFSFYTDVFAICFFISATYFGRKLTAIDPEIIEVYKRHLRYNNYYPPIPGIHAKVPLLRPSVPYYEGGKKKS